MLSDGDVDRYGAVPAPAEANWRERFGPAVMLLLMFTLAAVSRTDTAVGAWLREWARTR